MTRALPTLLVALLLGGAARAQVPAANQATLMLKILSFDRNLAARAKGAVRVAVVFREGQADSEAAASALFQALDAAAQKNSVSGLPVKVERVPAEKLDAALAGGVSAVYLCPGLDDAVGAVSKATQAHGALSFTATEDYLKAGASVALVRRAAKVAIVVHLPHARAEGADLDSGLLRIAEVIR